MSIICVHSNFETPDLLKEKKEMIYQKHQIFTLLIREMTFVLTIDPCFIRLKIGKKDTDR